MDLAGEPVEYSQRRDPRHYLRRCGATEEEVAYLVRDRSSWSGWNGERVELNAMTSEEFVGWLEGSLEDHGVGKVVPSADILATAYRRATYHRELARSAKAIASNLTVEVPDDLLEQVREHLDTCPDDSWDEAVVAVLESENEA